MQVSRLSRRLAEPRVEIRNEHVVGVVPYLRRKLASFQPVLPKKLEQILDIGNIDPSV